MLKEACKLRSDLDLVWMRKAVIYRDDEVQTFYNLQTSNTFDT